MLQPYDELLLHVAGKQQTLISLEPLLQPLPTCEQCRGEGDAGRALC
jgi:hypothetical protein